MEKQGVSQWLAESCQREGLSLRQAAIKTGLSHSTLADIKRDTHPSPQTIKKLAEGFGGDGSLALEDYLLGLAGYRIPRPVSGELAQVIDKVNRLSQAQVKIVGRFADFLTEIGGSQENRETH